MIRGEQYWLFKTTKRYEISSAWATVSQLQYASSQEPPSDFSLRWEQKYQVNKIDGSRRLAREKLLSDDS